MKSASGIVQSLTAAFDPAEAGAGGDGVSIKVHMPRAVHGRWSYRRLGFQFGPEETVIPIGQLASGEVDAARALIQLASERPFEGALSSTLAVVLVAAPGDCRMVADDEIAELRSFVTSSASGG